MPFRRGRVATIVVTIGLGGELNIRPGKETISSRVYFLGIHIVLILKFCGTPCPQISNYQVSIESRCIS